MKKIVDSSSPADRLIPFSSAMVKAERAGLKTQTRRPLAPQPDFFGAMGDPTVPFRTLDAGLHAYMRCPYGKPGDRLRVREAFRVESRYDALPPSALPPGVPVWFEADGPAPEWAGRYRHARFMPRRMTRTVLEITAVAVERLHEISETNALADGGWTYATCPFHKAPEKSFLALWESIYGADSLSSNPWLWAISFRRIES